MSQTRSVPHGSHWGPFTALVENGRMIGAVPAAQDPDPSGLIHATADLVHHEVRVARPMARRGWLEGGPGAARAMRGRDEFVALPWDEALDRLAGELDRVRREHGNAAIFGGSYGWSSAGRFHHAKTQLHRFLNSVGGFTDQVQNYSYAAAITILPHILGSYEAAQGPVSSFDGILAHGEAIVSFGGIPRSNLQVEAGGCGAHSGAHWLRECAKAGIELVCVTPCADDVPTELGARWVPIRPNTDTAVLLAMAHTLLEAGEMDRDFLQRCCVGADVFFAYLRGEADGTPKSAQWAEAISGVPAGEIDRLARLAREKRSMVNVSWALQRADHGEQPLWAAIALAAMAGHMGRPGGGFACGLWSINGLGNPRRAIPSPRLDAGRNPAGSFIPVSRVSDMLLDPGGAYRYNGKDRTYPDIRLVYWCGGNPFHHHQDVNRLVRAFQAPETVVVHEPWWTATARHADLVLPATTTLERDDIGASARDRYLVAMKRAVAPVGEARDDYAIFAALAARLGAEADFTQGRDAAAWLETIYEEARAGSGGAGFPPFDRFWEEGLAEVAPPNAPRTMFEDLRADPAVHRLPTPSGKIEIFSQTVAGFADPECPGHPVWLEPCEWLGGPGADRHPLHLLTPQPATRLHGQLDPGRVSLAAKVRGREPVFLHPDDAAARGIADGDLVTVYNDRGRVLAGARLNEGLVPGVVRLATGAWYDPQEPGEPGSLDKHGSANVLTIDKPTCEVTQALSAHSALVEIAPYREDAPAITAFAPPRSGRAGSAA